MTNKLKRISTIIFFLAVACASHAQTASYEVRVKLGEAVSSPYDETSLLVTPDGNTLYIVRSFHPENEGGVKGAQDIWVSKKGPDGNWQTATNLGKPVNNKFHNVMCGVSEDGNTMYLSNEYQGFVKVFPGISRSRKQGNSWSLPEKLNYNFQFPSEGFFAANVSADGKIAIVSFQGTDSKGLEDLYVMQQDANGVYADPVNLGSQINSSGFETTPFLAPDGKTLYFTSNGFGGSGDGDIFKTSRLDETWKNWSKPENIGSRLNTRGFDGSFTVDKNGNAYYVSGDSDAGQGDVYTISMIAPPPPPLPPPPPPPAPAPEPVAVKEEKKADDFETYGVALFEFNSYRVTTRSGEDLKKVVGRLKKNKKYKIQVEGHTDNVGSEEYNQKLSDQRAQSVKKHLIKSGINASRISSKGFGELNPVSSNETEDGRTENRRVEVKYYFK